MKKNRNLLLVAALPFIVSSLSSCSGAIPTFDGDGKIRLAAYGCLLPKGVLGSNINTLTEENAKKLSEAGFTDIWALYEGNSTDGTTVEETATKYYQSCEKASLQAEEVFEKCNVRYYPKDWTFYGMYSSHSGTSGSWMYSHGVDTLEEYREVMKYTFPDNCQYVKSSAYAGNLLSDEPCLDEMQRIAWQAQAYKERMKEIGAYNDDCFVNLLPNGASYSALGGTYDEYLDKYMETIAPILGYIGYDFYPFLANNKSYMKTTYLLNYEQVATRIKASRQNGLDLQFRTFVQTKSDFTNLRPLTNIGDFRIQLYSNLAFGSDYITFFEYTGKADDSDIDGEYALINLLNGKYNWTYEAAKKANNEVHSLDKVITEYYWDGVMFKNADEMIENQNFANLQNPLQNHARVSFKDVEKDAYLTTFKHKKNSSDAFMLVNFNDPYTELGYKPTEVADNKVTLHFNNTSKLLMYRLGQRMVVDLPSNGDYTFNLYPGEGRFIIPIK